MTERKATLVAKDFLRLRYSNPSLNIVSVFCFPKCETKQCIIEIRVQWENFVIYTHLERFQDFKQSLERLKSVIVKQNDDNPLLKKPDDNLMTLSKKI